MPQSNQGESTGTPSPITLPVKIISEGDNLDNPSPPRPPEVAWPPPAQAPCPKMQCQPPVQVSGQGCHLLTKKRN